MNSPVISGISLSFSSKYSLKKCPQRLDKDPTRPYLYLSIRIDGNEFVIPFHGNLQTKHSFQLGEKLDPTSGKKLKTGINYTKALVITDSKKDLSYPRTIPTIEYKKLQINMSKVIQGFKKYLKEYEKRSKDLSKTSNYSLCRISTLQYFHKELGFTQTPVYLESNSEKINLKIKIS